MIVLTALIALAFAALFFALFQWRESFFDQAQQVREGQYEEPAPVFHNSFHASIDNNGGQHDHV